MAEKLYEDEHALGFLDIHPQAPGHTVVIPRHHSPTLAGLPQEEVGPLFLAVQVLAERLVRTLGADGLTIGLNQGDAAGQTIPHLHILLFPRFKGDGGGSVHSAVHNAPKESLTEIAQRIRN
jgi:histidine triad (HIT) family protein